MSDESFMRDLFHQHLKPLDRRVLDLETYEKTDGPCGCIDENEIRISAISAPRGANAPNEALRSVGAIGNILFAVLEFSKVTQQDIHFIFHAPYDMDFSVPGEFHLMWLPGPGWTVGNYMWRLEYLIKEETDPYNTGNPTTISEDVTPANAINFIETEFSDLITFTSDEDLLFCHLFRDVALDNGDDTGDVYMLEFKYTPLQ